MAAASDLQVLYAEFVDDTYHDRRDRTELMAHRPQAVAAVVHDQLPETTPFARFLRKRAVTYIT